MSRDYGQILNYATAIIADEWDNIPARLRPVLQDLWNRSRDGDFADTTPEVLAEQIGEELGEALADELSPDVDPAELGAELADAFLAVAATAVKDLPDAQ